MCFSQSCVYMLYFRMYVCLWVVHKMIHTDLKQCWNLSFFLVKLLSSMLKGMLWKQTDIYAVLWRFKVCIIYLLLSSEKWLIGSAYAGIDMNLWIIYIKGMSVCMQMEKPNGRDPLKWERNKTTKLWATLKTYCGVKISTRFVGSVLSINLHTG